MDRTSSDVVIPDEDPLRTYSAAEKQQLTENLRDLKERIHGGQYSDKEIRPSLVSELHDQIFRGVRDFAGRMRGPGTGSEYVIFGPHRSVSNEVVDRELEGIFQELRRALASLEENPNDPQFEVAAIRVAAWAHAEVIRVHPFEDGNGRALRAFMNLLLVRLGLRPIPIEVPKQEYLACLNHYYNRNDLQPFIDLCVQVAAELDLNTS